MYKLLPLKLVTSESFAKSYTEWANDEEVMKFLYQGTFPVEPAEVTPIYDAYTDHNKNLVFMILKRYPGSLREEPIGVVGIHDIHWISGVGEFRILIGDQNSWGKGLGKRFLEEMMVLAFEKYNFHKLWLGYNGSHRRAEGAYTKSGFKHEATLKQHHYKNGQYNDIVRMAMFRDDYQAWKASQEEAEAS